MNNQSLIACLETRQTIGIKWTKLKEQNLNVVGPLKEHLWGQFEATVLALETTAVRLPADLAFEVSGNQADVILHPERCLDLGMGPAAGIQSFPAEDSTRKTTATESSSG